MEVLTFFSAVCKTYVRENPPPQNGQKKGSGYLYFMYLKLLVLPIPPMTYNHQALTPFDKTAARCFIDLRSQQSIL